MKRATMDEYLASAPRQVRQSMIANSHTLEAGAAAAVGRFFALVAARHEPLAAPSARSFREAAASESVFRMLLRTLSAHAPMVSTAAALSVKAEWVALRPRPKPVVNSESLDGQTAAAIDTRTWPASWQIHYRGLEAAGIKPSSLRRYRASIHRCAQLVGQGIATEALNFFTAYQLAEALQATPPENARQKPLRASTVANYIEGLVALGRHGLADPDAMTGVRFVRDHLRDVANAGDKLKFERIDAIMDQGGFEFIADTIGALVQQARSLPDHSAEKTKSLQTAALCAVSINKPGRTGDVSRWRIGEELQRDRDGTWRLEWVQEKTTRETAAGALWPEVSELLDELILMGRPDRFIHLRYGELFGANWMTHRDEPMSAKWPSTTVKAAIGIPLHDLRTLAADYLRLHDPENAADIIGTHLGHASQEAGEAYRAACNGDAVARSWANMRASIAAV